MKFLFVIFTLIITTQVFAHGGEHHKDAKKKITKEIKVEIGKKGFAPGKISAKKGEHIVLAVTRKTDKTCIKNLKHPAKENVTIDLPLNEQVKVDIGSFKKEQSVTLLCGMGMKAGVIDIR